VAFQLAKEKGNRFTSLIAPEYYQFLPSTLIRGIYFSKEVFII
jgi:hypothetical protein